MSPEPCECDNRPRAYCPVHGYIRPGRRMSHKAAKRLAALERLASWLDTRRLASWIDPAKAAASLEAEEAAAVRWAVRMLLRVYEANARPTE